MRGGMRRWWGWAAALVLTVIAIRWVGDEEAPPSPGAAVSDPVVRAAATQESPAAGAPAPVASELRLERLRREPYPPLKSDPFKGDLAFDPASPEEALDGSGGAAQRSSGPPPPPPVPFTYMGKMLEDGEAVVFLTRDGRNYVVRKGATLDGQYRVDAIGTRTMELTYLPAKAKQSLAIGSAP